MTIWKKWRTIHPETMVLSLDTGYDRDYSKDPYENYYKSRRGLFGFIRGRSAGHDSKEMVAGVTIGDRVKAYPMDALRQKQSIVDTFAGRNLIFTYQPETGVLMLFDDKGEQVPYVTVYWFVWLGIHPETERF